MPRSAFLWLALHFPLFLPAATEEKEIHLKDEPYLVRGKKTFKQVATGVNALKYDRVESVFWFRLEPGAELTLNSGGYQYATLCIETRAPASNPASVVVEVFQYSPVVFRSMDGESGTGVIRISGDWPDTDEEDSLFWNPASFSMECDLEIASPLAYREGHYFRTTGITIPAGRTLRLCYEADHAVRRPLVVFADRTSTLAFADSRREGEPIPEEYLDPAFTSKGTLSFERAVSVTLPLDQYAEARFLWPADEEKAKNSKLTLIEAGEYAGRVEVPAFPEGMPFVFLQADGTPVTGYKVAYGEETNVLTWKEPAYEPSGFWGLPVDVSTEMAGLIPEGKTAGEVTGPHTVEEAAEALRCFSGIAKSEPRQEDATVVDLRVDYAFGISRLTVVDGGKNALVEVTLTSGATTDAPDFRVEPVLVANDTPLDVKPLTEEAVAERRLTPRAGAATRWFLVPLDNVTGPLSVRVE